MPVWDLPEGDEMGPRPGVRSLTRNRDKATAYLGMYVRPHNLDPLVVLSTVGVTGTPRKGFRKAEPAGQL